MFKHRSIRINIPRIPINKVIQKGRVKRKPLIHRGAVESVILQFTLVVMRVHGTDILIRVIPDLLGDVNGCMGKLRNEID